MIAPVNVRPNRCMGPDDTRNQMQCSVWAKDRPSAGARFDPVATANPVPVTDSATLITVTNRLGDVPNAAGCQMTKALFA
jgi:hypothetical protein